MTQDVQVSIDLCKSLRALQALASYIIHNSLNMYMRTLDITLNTHLEPLWEFCSNPQVYYILST